MTAQNELQREIAELRDHFDERMNSTLKWGIGLIVAIAGSLATWELVQNQNIAENATISVRNAEDIREISRTVNLSSQSISRLSAQIDSQSETLKRIDSTLSELTRYLRGMEGRQ